MPKFSIVVPCYNNAQYLTDCLNSILAQDFQSWEVVVVIDASPDNSLQVAESFAARDARFRVVNREINGGSHAARKTGVSHTTGDYATFIDPDDEFFPGAFSALARVIDGEGASAASEADAGAEAAPVGGAGAAGSEVAPDIIHFGLKCVESDGAPQAACAGFDAWANSENAELPAQEAMSSVFSSAGGYRRDWNVAHRLFRGSLARSVFESLSQKRLTVGEDGYEFFALASQSRGEVVRDSIVGYKYFIGRGLTSTDEMSVDAFQKKAHQIAEVIEETNKFAGAHNTQPTHTTQPLDLAPFAQGFSQRLIFSLANEWYERVSSENKVQAAQAAFDVFEAAKTVGGQPSSGAFGEQSTASTTNKVRFAAEIARLVKDAAYALHEKEEDPTPAQVQEVESWFDLAQAATKDAEITNKDYAGYFVAAKDYLSYIRPRLTLKNPARKDVAIYVAAHKQVDLYGSKIMKPIQVGAGASDAFPNMAHDNEGENISHLNPSYCEMTAQYWAWKNTDSPYVGFCHYRRYFNFNSKSFEENQFGEVLDYCIDGATQYKYKLDDNSICAALQGVDVLTTREQDIRRWAGPTATNRSLYADAPHLHVEDLDTMVAILIANHPEYEQDAIDFLTDHKACFCNMYIMKREIFSEYCAWLFPLVEQFCQSADMGLYSKEGLRTPGHLAERLFNIYMRHEARTRGAWVVKHVQCVHYLLPDKYALERASVEKLNARNKNNLPVVPVVFAADNNYVPMLTTTIYSMLKNASDNYCYDVVVLQRDIKPARREVMQEFFDATFENAHVRFVDVSHVISKYNLKTNNKHISVETYYRFLIQELLPQYSKVLYLDSDLIIKGDVSELFNVDLGSNLVAAVPDIDFAGNVNMPGGGRMKYAHDVLGLHDPYSYFQAGVLVLNTQEMRDLYPMWKWLEIASDNKYIYNDQDVLNAHCQGRVTYLPYNWNVMNDCGGRIASVFSFAPAGTYDAFLESRKHEKIVHYAGFEKPWTHKMCDRAPLYWEYARHTPFYELLVEILCSERLGIHVEEVYGSIDQIYEDMQKHERVVGADHGLRKVVDPIAPVGSRRRETLKGLGRTLRGRR